MFEKGKTLNLTNEAVRANNVKDWKVVIVPQRMSAGYNLSRLSAFVTSVYPGDSATREQLRKRVNRLGNTHDLIHSTLLHGGVLSNIHAKQELDTAFGVIVTDLEKQISGHQTKIPKKSLKRKRK